jgi:hypothetical protein
MNTSNDPYAGTTLLSISLLVAVDIGPFADANPLAAFDG